jgi:hypothetical protein
MTPIVADMAIPDRAKFTHASAHFWGSAPERAIQTRQPVGRYLSTIRRRISWRRKPAQLPAGPVMFLCFVRSRFWVTSLLLRAGVCSGFAQTASQITPPSLDERFHETCRFRAFGPHPEEQVFARGAKSRVSKDGRSHDRRPRPSFETHRLRDAPQDEVRGGCRYDKNLGNASLGPQTPEFSSAVAISELYAGGSQFSGSALRG